MLLKLKTTTAYYLGVNGTFTESNSKYDSTTPFLFINWQDPLSIHEFQRKYLLRIAIVIYTNTNLKIVWKLATLIGFCQLDYNI